MTLENIAVKYLSAKLSSLEYQIRFRKCVRVGDQLSNRMKWMSLIYILDRTENLQYVNM